MKFRVRCHILFGLVALLQFSCAWGKRPEKDQALMLQMKVENLIEKILRVIQDYYSQIRTELKCIPDEVPDTIIGTLKKSIDCVDQNERNYDSGRITPNMHKKNFLKCFSDAKTEVEETITSINPNLDYCPENMTEKTYQINVTTTFTKTFHINIKNGLEIIRKQVQMGNHERICVFNQGEGLSDQVNQSSDNLKPTDNLVDEDQSYDTGGSKDTELYSKGHHGKGYDPKEYHGKGHGHHPSKDDMGIDENLEEFLGKGHESKEDPDKDYESKEHLDKGHESKEHLGMSHQSKDHLGKGHESEEHLGKEDESKEHLGKGHESKEHLGMSHQSKEHLGKGHESEEHLGKEDESKEHLDKGHESKEHLGPSHQSKEHLGMSHQSKEHLGKGHESKEHLGPSHQSKEHLGKEDESKEHLGKGHESKEHLGKGHESKEGHQKDHFSEEVLGISLNSGGTHGGNDSPDEDEFVYETGQQVGDYDDENNDYDENKSDVEDDADSKEHHENGHASKENHGVDSHSVSAQDNDDDDDDVDDQDAFFNVDEYDDKPGDQVSDSSDAVNYDHDEKGDMNPTSRPDSTKGDGKGSQTEEHHTVGSNSKEFHGKGHTSKEYSDKGFDSVQPPEYYEESQIDDDDYAPVPAADDDDDDEEEDFVNETDQNIINSNVDDETIPTTEVKNKAKEKNVFSSLGPIADDDDYGNDDSGMDEEKIFFPETLAKTKITTESPIKLATETATESTSDRDYYADLDAEPEDSNYGHEYYDAPEKEKNLTHSHGPQSLDNVEKKLAQSKPIAQVKSRIQIKPRNQFKQKPKKQKNNERHKIKLPKASPKKIQPETASKHRPVTSLAQSFLQSDF